MTSLRAVPLMTRAEEAIVATAPLHVNDAAEVGLAIPTVDVTRATIVKIENLAFNWLTRTVIVNHFSQKVNLPQQFQKNNMTAS
jgi:hypothetical protein